MDSSVSLPKILRVHLTSAFSIESETQSIHLPTRKTEALFAYLILHPGIHTREKLAALFWGDSPESAARGSLRKALTHLRKNINNEIVLADRETVQLNQSLHMWVDIIEFQHQAQKLLSDPSFHPFHMIEELYQGDLLVDFYEEWILPLREQYRNLYLAVLLRAVEGSRAQSEYELAVEYAQKILAIDPANERVHQHLMFCYITLGDRNKALQQYEACRQSLQSELGVEPTRETQALYQWIKQIASETQSLAARLTNLPIPISSFVGRNKELAKVKQLLSNARLVTLTGAGGSGKTRLAIHASTDLIDSFKDGVWWVELAPLTDPLLVPSVVAKALGIESHSDQPLTETLKKFLHTRKVLLVLDNCEHLIDACAQLTETLLTSCADLKILATSREALSLTGEYVWQVPALSLPEMPDITLVNLLMQYEGIRLFAERAVAINPEFIPSDENAIAIAQICQHLDGIPLAIELAAARIKTLSIEEITNGLNDRFQLLTAQNRTAQTRHQTLRAAVDWSYELLSEDERRLFCRLSVFSGGWTLEAAEAVCSGDGIEEQKISNMLGRLVDKSLITISADGQRYGMLETMRQYGDEKLILVGEKETLRESHLIYYLHLVETAEPYLRRAEQVSWIKRLDVELENLRTALRWSLKIDDTEPAMRLGGALGKYWDIRGDNLEGARWLDLVLRKAWIPNRTTEKTARAKVLYYRAEMASALDEMDVMKTSAESALALCIEVNDIWGTAYSRALVATYYLFMRVAQECIPLYEQSLQEFKRMDDVWGQSRVSSWLSHALFNTEKADGYAENLQNAIAFARRSGDRFLIAKILLSVVGYKITNHQWDEAEDHLKDIEQLYTEVNSSKSNWIYYYRTQIFIARGQYQKAKSDAELFIEYCIRVGEKNLHAVTLFYLAWISEFEHNLFEAVDHGEKGLKLFREMENPALLAFGLVILSFFKYEYEDTENAKQHARECLDIIQKDMVGGRVLLYVFCYLGGIFVEKNSRTAVEILAFSESWAQSFPSPRDLFDKLYYDRFLAIAREKLSDSEFTSAWEAGRKLTLDEAVELAKVILN